MDNEYKIVDFSNCSTCIHYKDLEVTEPCFSCLTEPTNLNSTRPVKYEKETK